MSMEKEEIVEEFENFLNYSGQWQNFKEWIWSEGYELSDFGMEDD